MPVRIISIPLVVAVLVALYFTWEVDSSYAIWIVPPVVLLAVIYILSPQINWWWYRQRPPKLDPMIEMLLGKYCKLYRNLPAGKKKLFRGRVALYMLAKEFMPQGMESVAKDVKGLIAACPVWLTLGREDFLLSKFERIIIYPHPFPTPQYPKKFHTSEIYEEDGVILFSVEHFMQGFLHPEKFFHSGLYEYARIFISTYPDENYPVITDDFWKKTPYISGLKKAAVKKWIGLPDIDNRAVAVVHFFIYPERFRRIMPEAHLKFAEVFNLDPADYTDADTARMN